MDIIKAGKFTLLVSDPYPVWLTLSVDGIDFELRFDHTDITDLAHVVRRAEASCRRHLPEGLRVEVD